MAGHHLLACLLVGFISSSQAGVWNQNVPFADAGQEPDVEFFPSSTDRLTRIRMVEELNVTTRIAIINYVGLDNDPPIITSFEDGGSNEVLGAEHEFDGTTWYLVITKKQDYEIPSQQAYVFTYNTGVSGGHRVALAIRNINDNKPDILPESSTCLFTENEPYPTSTCTFMIHDNDGRGDWPFDKMEYGITRPNTAGDLFVLKYLEDIDNFNARAMLTVGTGGLDYEEFSVHIIELFVNDDPLNPGNQNQGKASYVVRVDDVSDTPPFWKTPIIPQTLLEEETHTIQVTAADGDIGINADINYKLEFVTGSDDQFFSIDLKTGLISVVAINRDILESDIFQFNVTAFEESDVTSFISSEMFVIIKDINDNEPIIQPAVLEVEIDEETAAPLDLTITIDDPDLADFGTFSIELRDDVSGYNWHENFLLIPKNGYQSSPVTISVRTPQNLDFEVPHMQVMTMQLVATEKDNSSHVDIKNIIVRLIDLNDEFPAFGEAEYFASIEENSKKGVTITTIMATDPDAEDVVKHTLTSQSSIMDMDELTGLITVAIDTAFDYERQTAVVVQVQAEDLEGHRTFVQLTINVDDVNDVQPDLTMPTTQPSVIENTDVGTAIVANIFASDVDTDALLEFSIDWDKSFATKQGARVQDTALFRDSIEITTEYPDTSDFGKANGNLKVKTKILDYEAYDTLTLNIIVTDTTTAADYPQSVSRSALLAIDLQDVNDNAPVFTDDSMAATRSVMENSGTDWLVGSVIATDADGPGNNDVRYSITEANPLLPLNLVKIDEIKGELRVDVNGGIDCDTEYFDKLLYTVTATDGVWTTDLTITIDIIDMNDNVPQFQVDEFVVRILENSPSGFDIIDVSGNDIDFSRPYHTISYFLSPFLSPPEIRDLFKIDEENGKLTVEINTAVTEGLDRDEGFSSYEIQIVLRDNYNQSDSLSAISQFNDTLRITVILDDVNDNDPILEPIAGCIDQQLDEIPAGTQIYPDGILATDKDDYDNGNGRVTFSILSVTRRPDGFPITPDQDLFGIDTTNNRGFLKTIASVKNFWGTYYVELMAKDHGPPGEERSGTEMYEVCILPMNDYDPVITYPIPGQTLRILMEQTVGGPILDTNNIPLLDFTATDQDLGENGKVDLTLEGNDLAKEYFQLVPVAQENRAQLRLRKDLNEVDRVFLLDVLATDNGTPKRTHQVTAKVVVIIRMEVEPEFAEPLFEPWPWFVENSPSESATIPIAIDDENFELTPDDDLWQPIYYYIIGTEADSPGLRFFALDSVSGLLTLTEPLDSEEYRNHTLYVLATNIPVKPNTGVDPSSPSQLTVYITVRDTNDNPPKFDSDIYPGGVSKEDLNGKQITRILATDLDLNDTVTYDILQHTMEVSDPSLENVKDQAFLLSAATIEGSFLILNFNPDASMTGFFTFDVIAFDLVGANDTATVKIYIITDSNRVTFKFNNKKKDVDDQRLEVQSIFTKTLGYNCAIDSISYRTDGSGNIIETETFVTAHFIDATLNQPVENTVITQLVTMRETALELMRQFLALNPPLDFVDYDDGSTTPQDIEALLKIILIVVSVVLGTLVILLFAAFFFKTRSLNRRLEALSTTKFGSQDSGLNRVGMSMPGANKRALEGSNPVWNEDIHDKDFDNISQGSYESGMIGIEDNPEFNAPAPQGNGNVTYNMEGRPSINPLSNGALNAQQPPEYVEIIPTTQDSDFNF